MATLVLFSITIFGCSSTENAEKESVSQPAVGIEENEQESNVVIVEDEEYSAEEQEKSEAIKPITKQEFDSKFKRDPDEKQYENGKTELKDGTVLNVDEIVYSNGESFDYVITTFFEGNLVHMQVETSKSTEEALNGLGLSENDYVRIKPSPSMTGIFDVVFDERFADENIAVFPSEWDYL